jgi:hypothetical protein
VISNSLGSNAAVTRTKLLGSSFAMTLRAAAPLTSHSAAKSFRKASLILLRLPLIRPPVLLLPTSKGFPRVIFPAPIVIEQINAVQAAAVLPRLAHRYWQML